MKVAIKQIGRFCISVAVVALAAATSRAAPLPRPVYGKGHCDLRASYTAGDSKMTLNYHFGTSVAAEDGTTSLSGKYASTDLYTRVPDNTRITVPNQTYVDFMGADVGDDVWILPQSTTGAHEPFLGFSTEEFSSSDWSTDITYTFLGVNGPGQFSMWGVTGLGTLSVYWSSYDEETTRYGDNTYKIPANTHKHANWGFTAPGVYDVQVQIKGTLTSGAVVASDVQTFTFLVGSNTVPEPGTMTLLSLAAVGVLFGLWKRRKKGG